MRDSITGILIVLRVGSEQALFLLLGDDGSISRKGDGSTGQMPRDMTIGALDKAVFEGLRQKISDALLEGCGKSFSMPQPRGTPCELTIAFRRAAEDELVTGWRYGAESEGPPPEVREFVIAALDATDDWYHRMKLA